MRTLKLARDKQEESGWVRRASGVAAETTFRSRILRFLRVLANSVATKPVHLCEAASVTIDDTNPA